MIAGPQPFIEIVMLAFSAPRTRRRQPKIVVPAGPVPLVLEAVSYDSVLMLILLTFNQPVNTTNGVVSQFIVNDPVTHNQTYAGAGPLVAYGANGIQIHLLASGSASGSQVTCSIGLLNGIVAANNSSPLAAVSNLLLPYSHP